jgi:hypothetical protein
VEPDGGGVVVGGVGWGEVGGAGSALGGALGGFGFGVGLGLGFGLGLAGFSGGAPGGFGRCLFGLVVDGVCVVRDEPAA